MRTHPTLKTMPSMVLLTLVAGRASSESLPGATPSNYGDNNSGAFDVAVYRHPQTSDVRHWDRRRRARAKP
jgi:hypothetical protein